ncbi:16S rRNA pseudouridine(516) synthase [Halalkalibacillus sediminis]|uniref:Pseudouridine synthase n=1 Tax=Halalkalibacillus sediminis TaxID=2018042 RepID=A0A2I0QYC6_9BACI|nr:pseudouridine synthase [Halalkalibacillus sediminis]PKR79337.1 16S rRNA pseudouridine(516) synthase [Halalkalibacillus sediminis]
MRIDKLLSNQGFGSRKDVKKLLKKKMVIVDGETISSSSTHVDPETSEVYVGNEKVHYQSYIYLMMNKPTGVISATHDDMHQCVIDLIEEKYRPQHLFPVGRLDKDTTGLLLITNDGEFSHQLMSPKKHVDKVYEATVTCEVTDEDIRRFESGITLEDGYETKPALLKVNRTTTETSDVTITISEGKFHQIKRMFKAVDKHVLTLKRVKIGNLTLDSHLEEGQYRELTPDEIASLSNA